MRKSTEGILGMLRGRYSERELFDFWTDFKKLKKGEYVNFVRGGSAAAIRPGGNREAREAESSPASRIAYLLLEEAGLRPAEAASALRASLVRITGKEVESKGRRPLEAWIERLLQSVEPATVMRAAMDVAYRAR